MPTYDKRIHGRFRPLVWDGDGAPAAYYVNGHVTREEFRAAVEAHFGDMPRRYRVPSEAVTEHVYVRNVRAENDGWGNRRYV